MFSLDPATRQFRFRCNLARMWNMFMVLKTDCQSVSMKASDHIKQTSTSGAAAPFLPRKSLALGRAPFSAFLLPWAATAAQLRSVLQHGWQRCPLSCACAPSCMASLVFEALHVYPPGHKVTHQGVGLNAFGHMPVPSMVVSTSGVT